MKKTCVSLSLIVLFAFSAGHVAFAGAVNRLNETIRLEAHTSTLRDVTFRAGELARVSILGDGHSDVDIAVYDSAGRLVIKNANSTDNALVWFVPSVTATYTILVTNEGSTFDNVHIWTN